MTGQTLIHEAMSRYLHYRSQNPLILDPLGAQPIDHLSPMPIRVEPQVFIRIKRTHRWLLWSEFTGLQNARIAIQSTQVTTQPRLAGAVDCALGQGWAGIRFFHSEFTPCAIGFR